MGSQQLLTWIEVFHVLQQSNIPCNVTVKKKNLLRLKLINSKIKLYITAKQSSM